MGQRNESPDIDVVTGCMAVLIALEQEVRTATHAISCNRLPDLEESLWRQETMCARLKRSISAIRPTVWKAASAAPLRDAASRLREQTQIYEKLITQSRRSTAILQHLCSLYRNAAQRPGRAISRSLSREA